MDRETRYSCLSNYFDLISATDHKILKSPLTWLCQQVKGHQGNQIVPLYILYTLYVVCDTEEKKNGKKIRKQDLQTQGLTTFKMKTRDSLPTSPHPQTEK